MQKNKQNTEGDKMITAKKFLENTIRSECDALIYSIIDRINKKRDDDDKVNVTDREISIAVKNTILSYKKKVRGTK